MDFTLCALRIVVGLLFVGHGSQKLLGVFGGPGIDATAATFERIGLRPGRLHATAAGCAELGGGLLLALGLLTPLAAATITAVMVTAIIAVHARNGLWNTEKGFEYNLVLIAAAFAIVGAGPGAWSLDSAIGLDLGGTGWALIALAAGLIGSIGTVLIGRGWEHGSRERGRPGGFGGSSGPAQPHPR
jgi:putative oxidoreductase